MESIITYAEFWLLYVLFALLGLWCWSAVLFWLPKSSLWWRIWLALGVAILFTPSPTAQDPAHIVPAVFVLILDFLSNLPPLESPAALCLGVTTVTAVLIVLVYSLLSRNKTLQSS